MTDDSMSSELKNFLKIINKEHGRIDPCFMTGKGCVHTDHIDSEIKTRIDKYYAFNIRPFQPNIEAAHDLTIKRFLKANYRTVKKELDIEEADKIRRTGYVICEKICKRIQSSDFVIVDISNPNPNVFYELGLAYGIDQKILVIKQDRSKFGRYAEDYLKIGGCKVFTYYDLNYISPETNKISSNIWERGSSEGNSIDKDPRIVFLSDKYTPVIKKLEIKEEIEKIEQDGKHNKVVDNDKLDIGKKKNNSRYDDIELNFDIYVTASIGVAIDDIKYKELSKTSENTIKQKYLDVIGNMKDVIVLENEDDFNKVKRAVTNSYCTIIKTGGENAEPMSYFWLGYCHALGINVIPVTIISKPGENINDLAFDLRALWHMSFIKEEPKKFSDELKKSLLQMIINDFKEWSRRRFWDRILGKRGEVSIFTGALHNEPIGREMIGDWDLRAASELTSYFASQQYRSTIASPVYQIEHVTKRDEKGKQKINNKTYIEELEAMVEKTNCIIIASPDVNPLTEILLGKIYGIPKKHWFTKTKPDKRSERAFVAYKEIEENITSTNEKIKNNSIKRLFYEETTRQTAGEGENKRQRGFKKLSTNDKVINGGFLSQNDEVGSFEVHAHLIVARNPYNKDKNIIILNGVSGPATYALTHVLTGGVETQFVNYGKEFDGKTESEGFMQKILEEYIARRDQYDAIQYFIKVTVGSVQKEEKVSHSDIFDWRRIIKWSIVTEEYMKQIEYNEVVENII